MVFSYEQTAIIDSDSDKICVSAAAGSGKTRVLTERIKRLINDGVDPAGIYAITYTRKATEEMNRRLKNKKVNISTVHSLAIKIAHDNGLPVKELLDKEKYDDVIDLILHEASLFPVINYLLVDEFQDITDQQYELLQRFNAKNLFYVGDLRQCIYQFDETNPANPLIMESILKDPAFTKLPLTINYRCGARIGEFAEKFTKYMPYVDDDVYYMNPNPGNVNAWVENLTEIIDLIECQNGDYGDCAVLCRTKDEVLTVCEKLRRRHIPFEYLKKSGKSLDELDLSLQANTVKVLTIHSSKGLQFNNTFVIFEPDLTDPSEVNLAYVAATRAVNNLYWLYKKSRPLSSSERKRIESALEDMNKIEFE